MPEMPVSPSEEKKNRGYLNIDSDQLPEIKDWKVGGKYNVNLVIEQKSLNASDKDILNASFEILSANADEDKVSEEDYKDMSDDDKDKVDEKEVMG